MVRLRYLKILLGGWILFLLVDLRLGGSVPRAFRSTGTTARVSPATADLDGRQVDFELAGNR